jgi:hypothetical protein
LTLYYVINFTFFLLKKNQALLGASQIIELAIETLNKALPPPPPSVTNLRQSESSSKQAAVSSMRIEALRNRGKANSEDDGSVGKL